MRLCARGHRHKMSIRGRTEKLHAVAVSHTPSTECKQMRRRETAKCITCTVPGEIAHQVERNLDIEVAQRIYLISV